MRVVVIAYDEEELEDDAARWLQREFCRERIKHICELLRKLSPQEAIKFLERERDRVMRQQVMEFWELYYDRRYVRFIQRRIERLQRAMRGR